jgi:hypothetical protein
MKKAFYLSLAVIVFTCQVMTQTKRPVPKPLAPTKTDTPAAKESQPSAKVVVEKLNGDRLTGLFVAGTTDSVVVEVSGARLTLPFSDISVIRFSDLSAAEKSTDTPKNTAPDPLAQLSFEAAVVYSYGGAQPLARVNVLLFDDSVDSILRAAGLQPEKNISLMSTLGFAMKYPSQSGAFGTTAASALKPHLVATTTTGFDGRGQFSGLKPGSYWVFCYSDTRKGFAIWNLSVSVTTGDNHIVLDQKNAETAF